MRHHKLRALDAHNTRENLAPSVDESMQHHVSMHGDMAAAWLIWAHRCPDTKRGKHWKEFVASRSRNPNYKVRIGFRNTPSIDFKMPAKAPAPPWFRVAIERLKLSTSWTVTIVGNPSSKYRIYRIRWLGWGTFRDRMKQDAEELTFE